MAVEQLNITTLEELEALGQKYLRKRVRVVRKGNAPVEGICAGASYVKPGQKARAALLIFGNGHLVIGGDTPSASTHIAYNNLVSIEHIGPRRRKR